MLAVGRWAGGEVGSSWPVLVIRGGGSGGLVLVIRRKGGEVRLLGTRD